MTYFFRSINSINTAFVLFIFVLLTGCSLEDNATALAYQLEAVSKDLKSEANGAKNTIYYESDDSNAPFTILLLPEQGVTENELLEKGLDSVLVSKLFPQLSYVDLKDRSALIVYQNDKISFTTYYRRFVDVNETQIINGRGATDITVTKIGEGPGHIKDKIILVTLE
jgi:hypothetical protein